MKETSIFSIFAYTKPYISNGDNWKKSVANSTFRDFKVVNGCPDYEFKNDLQTANSITKIYDDLYAKITSYFRFDLLILEDFYQSIDFSKHNNVLNKIIWYDVQ